jgi:hypothetical protein
VIKNVSDSGFMSVSKTSKETELFLATCKGRYGIRLLKIWNIVTEKKLSHTSYW